MYLWFVLPYMSYNLIVIFKTHKKIQLKKKKHPKIGKNYPNSKKKWISNVTWINQSYQYHSIIITTT